MYGMTSYHKAMEEYAGYAGTTRAFRAIVRRFETTNSILAGEDVYHSIVRDNDAPHASTLGNTIRFNSAKLPSPDTAADIMFLTGVNNHELGHVKYTPTDFDIRSMFPGDTNLMLNNIRRDRVYAWVWNVLEDQRIEMLMAKRYANQKPYFINAFTQIVLKDPENYDTAYLLARGRRFLPVKIRRRLKKKFRVQAIIPDIRHIVDGYCKLNLFTAEGLWKANEFVVELIKLMRDNDLIPQTPPDDDGNTKDDLDAIEQMDHCGHTHDISGGGYGSQGESHAKKQDPHEVAQTVAQVAQDIDSDSGQDPAPVTGHQGSDDGAEGTDPGSGKGGDAEDATDESESPGSAGGESAGAGAGSETPSDDDIKKAAQALSAEQQDAEGVEEEVRQAELYIRGSREVHAPRLRERTRIETHMPAIARRMASMLRVEEAEADPYWLGGQTSGRLNVQAVMRGADREYVFDRWTDGGYGGNDQEWVVALDCSGSMEQHLKMLSEANWVMKRAANIVEAKMTTVAFGTSSQLVYGAEDTASTVEMPLMVDLGGTQPGPMIGEAHRLLTSSQRKQKGLLILTDGAWHVSKTGIPELPTPESVIKDLNARGILTHLVYFGTRGYSSHGCRTHGGIGELTELPKIFKDLVKSRMTKAH